MKSYKVINKKNVVSAGLGIMLSTPMYLYADQDLHFIDIAKDNSKGIVFSRSSAPNNVLLDAVKQPGAIIFVDQSGRANAPGKPHGAPGVAILDYDNDGDLDIYASNALGVANSLYSSQLVETGEMKFIDVADQAGVSAYDQETTGMCFGDIDNDGDHDLFVMGNFDTGNRLFENQGNGYFTDISVSSGTKGGDKHPSSCAMGDVNGDGLLDLLVGNTFDNWNHRLPLVTFDYDHLMESNQLFLNTGNNVFKDNSVQANITGSAHISWAVSLVDYDLDGDLDLITADDQGAKAKKIHGGEDDGYVRIYQNDGNGVFAEKTESGANTNRAGAWMGLSFGDLNSDGNMDIFSTNVGYYMTAFLAPGLGFPTPIGDWQNGWFLGDGSGGFNFPGVGSMQDNPFGWGTSITDYDNDGDSDIIYHGGMNMGIFVDGTNGGVLLKNDGNANFTRDKSSLSTSTNHLRRNVHGMAVGDLNRDGFMDIVSVSNEDWPEQFPLISYVPDFMKIGTPFDDEAFMWPLFQPVDFMDFTKGFQWTGLDTVNGSLSVELSSADNGNKWIKVDVQGSKDILANGVVNRDGIGAVIKFTPENGKTVMWPVVAGSSYASQDALEWTFGLGKSDKGVLEVMWPGGVKNKHYNIKAGESILIAEIPCSFDEFNGKYYKYRQCVNKSLKKLKKSGVLSRKLKKRYMNSAMKAYFESHDYKNKSHMARDLKIAITNRN